MSFHPRRILWPTDFSPLSLQAADSVKGFRELFQADLHVVHVCQPLTGPTIDVTLTAGVTLGITQKELLDIARAQLEGLRGDLFDGDRSVRFETLCGHAWQEVCGYAERAGVDLIVVGTHGRTGLTHVLMGSVAERIVQHAKCAVLVVKSNDSARP